MANDPFYKDHWINIDRDRLERYQRMFQWNPASSILYEPADIGPGHVVGDFGCGPGYTAIEIASWVGVDGHVHALDINSDFISQTRNNAMAAGTDDRISAHQCDGSRLPLPDASLDRLTTRNTLIYVDNAEHVIREFRRVLKAEGKVHAIEGDWPMMIVEPVPTETWAALVDAASHACRTPDIGRKLHGLMALAGFSEIDVQVVARPDTDGRLLPMIKNMAGYARDRGQMSNASIEEILSTIEQALVGRSYLALAPQFVVTATR
ncbi:methyltransferase domain-containing protein [Anderseniella sp. Alg231-50]|uniref:methyltransferase domain-containing protein n=1 Tax=Anderseniella sp. Alg231-50 TaxID=1922226 RepID=UPI000D54D0E1